MISGYVVFGSGGFVAYDSLEEAKANARQFEFDGITPRKWNDNIEDDGIYYVPDIERMHFEDQMKWRDSCISGGYTYHWEINDCCLIPIGLPVCVCGDKIE